MKRARRSTGTASVTHAGNATGRSSYASTECSTGTRRLLRTRVCGFRRGARVGWCHVWSAGATRATYGRP